MKIEVGKAYRTHGGWKATISEIIWPGYLRVKHDINGIDYLYHEIDGTVLSSSDFHRKYDLISEWTDEPAAEPAPKYRAGDLVTVCLNQNDADNWNHYCPWKNQIVSHTPAPFDWKDVKPGMAFKHMAGEDIWIYSGPWIRQEARGIYTTAERRGFFQELGSLCNATDISFSALTRAPEHDIEVKS